MKRKLSAKWLLRSGLLLLALSITSVLLVLAGLSSARFIAFVTVPLGAALVIVAVIAAQSGFVDDDIRH